MQAVDVLFGAIASSTRGERTPGKRQLHQNAVDRRIGVERRDQREQFRLAGLGRQRVLDRMEAASDRRPALAGDIGLARRIGADQHDRETRRDAARVKPRAPSATRASTPSAIALPSSTKGKRSRDLLALHSRTPYSGRKTKRARGVRAARLEHAHAGLLAESPAKPSGSL